MPGFGLSPYGTGPFGIGAPGTLTQQTGQLVASRLFDAVGRPVQTTDGSGAFEGMSDTLQRAYIALRLSQTPADKVLGDFEARQRRRVTSALRFLTDAKPPLLAIVALTVDTSRPSGPFTFVEVKDLSDGARITVRLPSTRAY